MSIVDDIMDLFARHGQAAYHGEAVSQTEHALQAAELAELEGAPDRLVVAAPSCTTWDTCSRARMRTSPTAASTAGTRKPAAPWLSTHFGPEVTEPIRLHVAAKALSLRCRPRLSRRTFTLISTQPFSPRRPHGNRGTGPVRKRFATTATRSACGTGTTRPKYPA